MPKVTYYCKKFSQPTLRVMAQAEVIIKEYTAQGFKLTLRQLYYQFVSRGWLENEKKQYDRLGAIISDGRVAGLIDWDAIEDRTRFTRSQSHWDNPVGIIETAAEQFEMDKWRDQEHYVEIWIEKDALIGVIEPVCRELDVTYFSCRGYVSQSEMWAASNRFIEHELNGREGVIIHLGDHDPSGIDMTRDIQERLQLFKATVKVERVALNRDQVDKYGPPPNPAKVTDSRFQDYYVTHGRESWELDALEPSVLAGVVDYDVRRFMDEATWKAVEKEQTEARERLAAISANWDAVTDFLKGK